MSHEVLSVSIGKIQPFRAPDEPSAIAKAAAAGAVAIGPLGLDGDEQADLVHHGGPDKAIHHYPADHYQFWRGELGDHPLLAAAGDFGENISTFGLVEQEVCIGDTFRLGTALVQVSQGRQPCWKLGHRFAVPALTGKVVKTRRCGWYYRVLEPGQVAAGDRLALADRPFEQWPVERVFGLLVAGEGKGDSDALRTLAVLAVLAESWRKRASDLLG